MMNRFRLSNWHAPADPFPLAIFRLFWGAALVLYVVGFFYYDKINDWYLFPRFHQPMVEGFSLPILPAGLLYAWFGLMFLSAVLIMLGKWFRLASIVFFVCYLYVFLLDRLYYEDEHFLILLVSFWMLFVRADLRLSLAAKRVRAQASVPAGQVLGLQVLVLLVVLMMLFAKLNPDWLFRGEPMWSFLDNTQGHHFMGFLLGHRWMAFVLSYGLLLAEGYLCWLLLSGRRAGRALGIMLGIQLLYSLVVFSAEFNHKGFEIGPFLYGALVLPFISVEVWEGWKNKVERVLLSIIESGGEREVRVGDLGRVSLEGESGVRSAGLALSKDLGVGEWVDKSGLGKSDEGKGEGLEAKGDGPNGKGDVLQGKGVGPQGKGDGPHGKGDVLQGKGVGPQENEDGPQENEDGLQGKEDGPQGKEDVTQGKGDGRRMRKRAGAEGLPEPGSRFPVRKAVVAFFVLFFAFQFLFPLRHHLLPGNVHYNQKGNFFSWFMKLNNRSSQIKITVTDPARDSTWTIDPVEEGNLYFATRLSRPWLAWQYAQFLKKRFQEQGIDKPVIKMDIRVAVNRREHQRILDPDVNLAEVEFHFFRRDPWILEFQR